MRVPPSISVLDARPGRAWTPDEFAHVVAWWSEREHEKLVWYCAARFLGTEATREAVEEVWLDFYVKLLPRARASYRPGASGFCTYLLDVCLKNHCRQVSRKLNRRREVSWTESVPVLLTM